jgi:hypothetical protein
VWGGIFDLKQGIQRQHACLLEHAHQHHTPARITCFSQMAWISGYIVLESVETMAAVGTKSSSTTANLHWQNEKLNYETALHSFTPSMSGRARRSRREPPSTPMPSRFEVWIKSLRRRTEDMDVSPLASSKHPCVLCVHSLPAHTCTHGHTRPHVPSPSVPPSPMTAWGPAG